MILQRAGVRYEYPMAMNTANDVRDVHLKFDRGCSKSIEDDRDDQEEFDDVRMACKLIEMRNWTDRRYRNVVRRMIEVDRGRSRCSRNIASLISRFEVDRSTV
jgi:hypothetical protein